jgi:ankyrin repeat protein
VNRVDAYGCTALWYACCRGNCNLLNWNVRQRDVISIIAFHLTFFESKVRLLLENRADINIPGFHGQTALMIAIRAADGQPDNVRLLLEYRADVEAKDERGRTALMIARSDKLVSLLLEYQADVNAVDKQCNTALLLASDEYAICDISIVRVLLANQADVNAANMDGKTALKASFRSSYEPVFSPTFRAAGG